MVKRATSLLLIGVPDRAVRATSKHEEEKLFHVEHDEKQETVTAVEMEYKNYRDLCHGWDMELNLFIPQKMFIKLKQSPEIPFSHVIVPVE